MDSDRIAGAAEEIGGKVEDAVGSVTGDAKLQADGKVDKVSGQVRSAFGQVKDAAREAVSHIDTSGLQGAARKVGGSAAELGSQVGQQVQEQPVVALLSAALIGGLIGYLAGRSR